DRWHSAVARQLEDRGKPAAELDKTRDSLKQQLQENPPVALLATNPLLLAMICALHRDKKIPPESQFRLIDELITVLIHERERQQNLSALPQGSLYARLNATQKRSLASDIAYYMLPLGVSTIPLETARLQIKPRIMRFSPEEPQDSASDVIRSLIER